MGNDDGDNEQSSEYVKLSQRDMEKANCCLCQTNVYDTLKYGEVYKINELVCHYFCLLLSSSLAQRGADDEGLLGFFPKDIRTEVRRGSRLRCSYCRKNGATIGCTLKSCKKKFHLPCGLKNGSMHQYFEQFRSYCSIHRLRQSVDSKLLKAAAEEEDGLVCPICYDSVSNEVSNDTLWAPCCKKRWFHRTCVERQAQAQGYFFKCPMCNNKDIFNKEMKNFGIYIPDVDAAWEREPNAFRELLHRYSRCDSEKCKCPDGRTFSQNTGSWRMLRCNSCGSQGTHVVCGGLKISAMNNSFRCPLCAEVLSKDDKKTDTLNRSNTVEATPNLSCNASSSSSSRRSAESLSDMQAPKRRKPSDLDVHLGHRVSGDQDVQPGPSKAPANDDEDDIIVVDDSESDIEVVDDKPNTQAPIAKIYPVPQYVHKDLFTKEGKQIKVVKLTAGDTVPVEDGSLGAVKMELPEARRETVITNSSAITNNTPAISPLSNTPPFSLLSNKNVSVSLVPTTSKSNTDNSTMSKQESSPLGIVINNVRHSEELFSPARSEPTLSTILQGGNLNLSSLQQQNIVFVPVSINGRIAAQAYMAPPGYRMDQIRPPPPQQLQISPHLMPSPAQLQQLQQLWSAQQQQLQPSKDVDVVTLD